MSGNRVTKKSVARSALSTASLWLKLRQTVTNKPAIVVAGIGRSGTTLLRQSLITNHGLLSDNRYTNASGIMFLDDYKAEHYWRGCVYKTHSFPATHELPEHVKVLWMFSNPFECVVSSARAFKGLNHYKNCQSPHAGKHARIFHEDVLLMDEHFRRWYRPQCFTFASIRYESLYDRRTINQVSRYLGFELKLLPYQPRKSNLEDHPQKQTIITTYRHVYERYLAAYDLKIFSTYT